MLPQETFAEHRAQEATALNAFPLQLADIRRTVHAALDLFGKANIFSQYTVHNYDHVHSMLVDVEKFIPKRCQREITKADWLMLTLSIYFHDLGLVVTEDEFANRHLTCFNDFKNATLFRGADGADYRQKIVTLGEDLAERFFTKNL